MARLTAAQRKALPASKFAGPGRSFPVEDKGHAHEAVAIASRQKKTGRLSPATANRIIAKAERVLKGKGK